MKILLYGVGGQFRQYFYDEEFLKNVIQDIKIEIVGVCDGNKQLWGNEVFIGKKKFLIQDIFTVDKKGWDNIVVTSKEYYEVIKKELINGGCEKDSILRIDEFVRKALFDGDYKYKLSLVLMIRNEGEYIQEWIEYHRLVGVEHFYIYDNQSTDHLKEILSGYITKGIVTYLFWKGGQAEAYNHALSHYKLESKYMGFNDTDEFIIPLAGNNIFDVIEDLFRYDQERFLPKLYPKESVPGGIGIGWRIYGTSDHKTKPEGLVIENYKYRANEPIQEACFLKTIANPRTVVVCDIHCMHYLKGYECISENGSSLPSGIFFDGHFEKIRINHYWSRSEEELYQKICRGSGCGPYHRDIKEEEKMTENLYERFKERLMRVRKYFNAEYDYIMEKYIEDVKTAISQHK